MRSSAHDRDLRRRRRRFCLRVGLRRARHAAADESSARRAARRRKTSFAHRPTRATKIPTSRPARSSSSSATRSTTSCPNKTVQLGIIHQSVAKGDTREHLQQNTGADGMTTFPQLEASAGIAYRVTVKADDATFAARPFNLPHDHGMHVVLARLPRSARSPADAPDRQPRNRVRRGEGRPHPDPRARRLLQRHARRVGPARSRPALAGEFHRAQFAAADERHRRRRGRRTKARALHGTFLPGENMVVFSWQLPYGNEPSLDIDVGLPPARPPSPRSRRRGAGHAPRGPRRFARRPRRSAKKASASS